MSFKRGLSLLLALFALRLLIATVSPVFETSEARYAAIAANMARSGDFTVPRFTYHDCYQSFDGKPPLQFQLSGLGCKALGVSPLAVRLPLLVVTALLTAFLGWTVAGLRRDGASVSRGLLAAGVAGTSVAGFSLAGFCMPDALLVPCVAAAFLCHARYLACGHRTWTWGVFAALGCGMLTKGPVALVLFGLPVFFDTCVNRRWREIGRYRWVSGTAIFLAIAAPWFVLMTRENPGFLSYFFINENLLRFLRHDYGDRYGAGREFFRGVAVLWAVVVTLPWSPFFLVRGFRRMHRHGIGAWLRTQFADGDCACVFAWGVVGIVFFWCLTSRVPLGYVIPVVPLFATWAVLRSGGAAVGRMLKVLPVAVILAAVALAGTLAVVRLTTHKLDGADAGYRTGRYSYEFYHGTPERAVKEAE